jgi:hypothetical protein
MAKRKDKKTTAYLQEHVSRQRGGPEGGFPLEKFLENCTTPVPHHNRTNNIE